MKKIILLWSLVLCLIASGCNSEQPKADTPKLNINKQVETFLNQVAKLESFTDERDILLDPDEEFTRPKIEQALSELRKKHVQSTEEAAEQKEKQIATELSFYYTKDRLKELEAIHQEVLDFQSEVNSQSGEHKALVQQAVNDFLKLTEADIKSFNDALNFISGVDPKLPKYSFVGVAEARASNCTCTEISRVRISPTLIRITYRCTCKVTIRLVQNLMQSRILASRSQMSLEDLKDLKAKSRVKAKDRTITDKYNPNPRMGKVKVDPTTGNRSVTNFIGERVGVEGKRFWQSGKEVKVNGQRVTVKYNKDGFPDFTRHTTYTTKLPRKDWFQSDPVQFNKLNKELYKEMSNTPALKTKIDDTFLSVLRHGNGVTKNSKQKMVSFLDGTPNAQSMGLTPVDIQRLKNGLGVTPETWARISNDPNMRRQLLQSNADWIRNGQDPVGYVWNHNEKPGIMQLVDRKIHDAVKHTGGRAIWGGGEYFRK